MIAALLESKFRLNIMALPVGLTAAGMIALGIYVILRERPSLVSVSFFFVTLFSSIWLFCFTAMYCASDARTALGWARLAYFGVPFIPAAVFHFTVSVLRLGKKWQRIAFVGWWISAFFMFMGVTTQIYLTGISEHWWGYYTKVGSLNILFLTFLFSVMILSLLLYRRQVGRSDKGSAYHKRAKTLMIAFAVGYLAVFDYFPAYGISLYPFGYIPVLLFLSVAAWTIARYRLIDITPAYAAEHIFEVMSDAVLVLDNEGFVRVINRRAYEIFELSRDDVGKKVPGMIPEDKIHRLYRTGVRQSYEKKWQLTSGKIIHIDVSIDVLYDRDARNAAGTLCVARDITERKHSEERIREMTKAMENAVEGVMRIASDGTCETVNHAFAELVSRIPSQIAGLPWDAMLYPEDAEKGQAAFQRMIRTGKSEFEAKVRRKDGSVFSGFIVLVRRSSERDEPSGAYCFLKDVTERKVKEALEARSDLIATVSHEMRTPLHAVREGVNVMLEGLAGDISREQEDILMATKSNLDRLVRLVNNALDFQRIESGLLKLRLEETDINSIVRETMRSTRSLILKSGLECRVELEEDLPKIYCDRDRIIQVLMNLIQNAVRYTSEGRIRIFTGRAGSCVEVSVEDTGIGIREDELSKLFKKFGQLESGFLHAKGGAGLGLVISSKIIDEHGGKMEVQSEHHKGSRFSFQLPADASLRTANREISQGTAPSDPVSQ